MKAIFALTVLVLLGVIAFVTVGNRVEQRAVVRNAAWDRLAAALHDGNVSGLRDPVEIMDATGVPWDDWGRMISACRMARDPGPRRDEAVSAISAADVGARTRYWGYAHEKLAAFPSAWEEK